MVMGTDEDWESGVQVPAKNRYHAVVPRSRGRRATCRIGWWRVSRTWLPWQPLVGEITQQVKHRGKAKQPKEITQLSDIQPRRRQGSTRVQACIGLNSQIRARHPRDVSTEIGRKVTLQAAE
jgi:hypothetical protein